MQDISTILNSELKQRQARNANYSLRSFAAFLKISPATLSQYISGKRNISHETSAKILHNLGLSPLEVEETLNTKKNQTSEVENKKNQTKLLLQDDVLQLIGNWYYFAILSLSELPDNKADPRWVANRLNIKVHEANEALMRLQRLGIIEVRNKKFKQIAPPLTTTQDIPSKTIQKNHLQILGMAQMQLELTSPEEREYTSTTMAINKKNIPKAKKYIREFKHKISDLLERGARQDVYTIAIQLFPLTKRGKDIRD